MLARHIPQSVRQWVIASYRRVRPRPVVSGPRRRSAELQNRGRSAERQNRGWRWGERSRDRAELLRVNATVGIEPIRPELSGLKLRRASVPRRVVRLLIQLAYRWQPSRDYRQRQAEMRELNRWLKVGPRMPAFLPPILLYPEDTDLLPTRLQPQAGQLPRGDVSHDLRDLEEAARIRGTRLLRPRLPEPDPEYLLAYRHLVPRRYRRFLRNSPYPRVVASVTAALVAVCGVLWVNQVQRAEAGALVRLHHARSAFRSELDEARAYGVDAKALRALEWRAGSLEARSAPSDFVVSRARASFYAAQARRYRELVRALEQAEKRALAYWTWKEGNAYAALVEATHEVNGLGLQASLPPIPACGTPACYQATAASQARRAAWLRETAGTLRVYGAAIASAQDPAGAAGAEVQAARALSAILPAWTTPPVRIADLDSMYATAAGSADYARVGALGRLDDDALRADLMRILPRRAIVISIEDQALTCYEHGRSVYTSPVTAGSEVRIGVFHIQARQASISTLYWSSSGASYHFGALPDWMALSGDAALQGAPWRTMFGAGSDASQPAYAPSTPGSIDLPTAAAQRVYRWAPIGTEVVVY